MSYLHYLTILYNPFESDPIDGLHFEWIPFESGCGRQTRPPARPFQSTPFVCAEESGVLFVQWWGVGACVWLAFCKIDLTEWG